MRVELCSKRCSVGRDGVAEVCPASQGRRFVVDEEAAVLDTRGFLNFGRLERVNGVARFNGHISEPVPWRDTDLLRNIVDAVDGTTAIAACLKSAVDDSEEIW